MVDVNATRQFADRLRDAMISAGFNSQRSTSGVSIHKLAEITGYSVQICRKYLRGEAMPELSKLIDISVALKVSPGWLAFGEISHEQNNNISISKESLRYIFTKSYGLDNHHLTQEEFPGFLLELVNAISLIDGTEEQNKKIIDLAFTSGNYFNSNF